MYYARRTRDFDEPLPWDHLDCTVSKAFLKREWEQAVAEKLTPDCRRGPCKGCNVCPELDTAIVDYKEGGRVEKNYVWPYIKAKNYDSCRISILYKP